MGAWSHTLTHGTHTFVHTYMHLRTDVHLVIIQYTCFVGIPEAGEGLRLR